MFGLSKHSQFYSTKGQFTKSQAKKLDREAVNYYKKKHGRKKKRNSFF